MKRCPRPFFGLAFFPLLLCILGCPRAGQPDEPDDFGTVSRFALVNQDGKKVTREDFQGKVWVASFIFTRCVGPCTQISGCMAGLQKDLAKEKGVVLVSITVDPNYDKPDVLKEYAARFRADPRRWVFLTGDKKKVYDLIVKSFKQGVQETPAEARRPGFEVTHSTRLALVDQQGHIRGYFDGTEPEKVNELRQKVRELAQEKS
jgi:protein SCO1/2